MATPVPPSQWARVDPLAGRYSQDPAAEAQLRRLRQQVRQQWEQAVATAPRVRALKERIETDWMPSMERDVAEAQAAVQAATDRLYLRVVAEQGYQVLEHEGRPAVFLSAEDQANDTDLVVANARLKAVTEGRRRLQEQLDEANQHLAVADAPPPPEA